MNKKLLALTVTIGYVTAAFVVFLLKAKRKTDRALFLPIRFFIALLLAMVVITFIVFQEGGRNGL